MDVHFRLIDSFQFLASSLDKLSSYPPATPITRQKFADISDEKFQLVTRKGVFPYERVHLIPGEAGQTLAPSEGAIEYSTLTGSGILDEDFEHARNVWSAFNIQILGEHASLSLKGNT